MSQETLCGIADLSLSHMSHIENGKTKVSLPTLIIIANALKTSVDNLLYDDSDLVHSAYDKDFHDLINGCTQEEIEIILQLASQIKAALKRKK